LEVLKKQTNFLPQILPMNNTINSPVFQQKFSPLEILRQLLLNGLLDHPWAGKSN